MKINNFELLVLTLIRNKLNFEVTESFGGNKYPVIRINDQADMQISLNDDGETFLVENPAAVIEWKASMEDVLEILRNEDEEPITIIQIDIEIMDHRDVGEDTASMNC